jgi:adenosine kinase
MRFLIHGSIAYDQLLGYDGSFVDGIDPKNLQALSVGYVAQHYVRHHGGTAANIAWNLRLLGHAPVVVGAFIELTGREIRAEKSDFSKSTLRAFNKM